MAEQTRMEIIKGEGDQLIEQIKRLVHEGNVRRIIIKQDERTVAEFPLTIGVIGVVLAPVFAAVRALAPLLSGCPIESSGRAPRRSGPLTHSRMATRMKRHQQWSCGHRRDAGERGRRAAGTTTVQ